MSARDPVGSTWSTRSIVRTMFPILVGLSVLEMGSGLVLETLEETYLGNPTLLVMVPVMIAMGGNLGAIMSSRLSTRLHLGLLSFRPDDRGLLVDVLAIIALAATVFALLGVATYAIGLAAYPGHPGLAELLVVSLVTGMSLAVLAVSLAIAATWISYRMGLDPDDTTIPVVTNTCDILGVVLLSVVATVVL
ncbi:MAG: magnesium transporter [Halobacteriales archaeon]